jgi:GNAT superfamily N-acetyltransferase
MHRFSDPELLARRHKLEGFDCGVESLNIWLLAHARGAAGVGSARTYVITDHDQDRVVGFHALNAASITHVEATGGVAKGVPRHPIPMILLARLAVDNSVKGEGLGAFLLRDAMVRAVGASEEIGARGLLVHALDDDAAAFYRHFGLEPSPTDKHNLQITIKAIRQAIAGAPSSP